MKSRSAARLKLAIALLLGIVIGFAAWFGVTLDHVQADGSSAAESYERGYSDGVQDAQPIIDKQMNAPKSGYMPLFLQKDPQWASYAYSDGAVGTYG